MDLISGALRGFIVFTALLLTCISLLADRLFKLGGWSNSFGDCVTLLEAQRKGEQLTREAQTTTERVQLKSRIAYALKNGEMKLIDAAAYYCKLHEDPKAWHYPRRPRPDRQDIVGWCREVIEWTEKHTSFHSSPGQVEALHQRLEAELQEQLERHGAAKKPK